MVRIGTSESDKLHRAEESVLAVLPRSVKVRASGVRGEEAAEHLREVLRGR